MDAAAPDLPPPYLGDYPHGEYFSAHAPEGFVDDDDMSDYTVTGDVIRFRWDDGVVVPLWADGEGLLPDDPEWLRRALGLSDSLIQDLRDWGTAMNDRIGGRAVPARTSQELDQQARELVLRLRQEVGARFTVVSRHG